MALAKKMKAIVVETPGPPSVLQIKEVPMPIPQQGQVLVKVQGFGINRSEMFTRQGQSPGLKFPLILGLELVGTIAAYPPGYQLASSDLAIGTQVATCMGGLGRQTSGSYAEYACPLKENIRAFPQNSLSLATLAALPEMVQTVYGSLKEALDLRKGESLLVRGATSSIGLMAMQIAKYLGASRVGGTSRSATRSQLLRDYGADQVFIDEGTIQAQVHSSSAGRYDKVLELVGTTTLVDSMNCLKPKGTLCMTGIQGGGRTIANWAPLQDIQEKKKLTVFIGQSEDFLNVPWDSIIKAIESGIIKVPVKQFGFDQLQKVHQAMEDGGGGHKMVVVIDD